MVRMGNFNWAWRATILVTFDVNNINAKIDDIRHEKMALAAKPIGFDPAEDIEFLVSEFRLITQWVGVSWLPLPMAHHFETPIRGWWFCCEKPGNAKATHLPFPINTADELLHRIA